MTRTPRIITTGYPSLDVIVSVERLPEVGETAILDTPVTDRTGSLGGCAVNVAVGCSRLGASSAAVVLVGDDEAGTRVTERLRAEQVDVSYTDRVSGRQTSNTLLLEDHEGNHRTYFFPGAADSHTVAAADRLPRLDDAWGIITVGNAAANLTLSRTLRGRGARLITSFRRDAYSFSGELNAYLTAESTVLVMNRAEAAWLSGQLEVDSVSELLGGAVELVVVTGGAEGFEYHTLSGSAHEQVVEPTRFVDATGAGDGFVAGLATALTSGADYAGAVRLGAVVASFVIEEEGCQTNLPTFPTALARYHRHYGSLPAWMRTRGGEEMS
jgi:adenosine kinase